MLNNYLEFLEYLMGSLNNYFKNQSPYIKCEKGCAKCCQNGDYPFSQIELALLKCGFTKLDSEKQQIILSKIKDIIKRKKESKLETFTYECPFLFDNVCSVYAHRGIICRTFGLISLKEGSKMQIPFCAYEGLNYSNVLDKEKDMLMFEKMNELGIDVEPMAYQIHYSYLTSDKISHAFNFEYGKKGSLIDLIEEDEFFKNLIDKN